jgi:hypothetical protein
LRLQLIDASFKRRFHIRIERDALREIGGRIPAKTKRNQATFNNRRLPNMVHLLLQHAAILEVLRRRFAPNSR